MGTGNSGFILVCSGMVFNDSCASFLWWIGKAKNILNTMMMVICTMGLASVLWVAAGYSLSFSGTGAFIGNIDKLFFQQVSMTDGEGIPEGLFAAFQMMFALITTAIITGSVVGRMRFSAIFLFIGCWLFWFTFRWPIWFGVAAS